MSRYDSILTLPHPVSTGRARMSRLDRAAQFAPFAALTGFDGEILEAGRLTEERIELDEDERKIVDSRLQILRDHLSEQPEVIITCFIPDKWKAGGAYKRFAGRVRRLDEIQRTLTMDSGDTLLLDDILAVEGNFLRGQDM